MFCGPLIVVVSHFGHWLQQMLEQMEENAEDECSIKISTKVHQEQHYFFVFLEMLKMWHYGSSMELVWVLYIVCLKSDRSRWEAESQSMRCLCVLMDAFILRFLILITQVVASSVSVQFGPVYHFINMYFLFFKNTWTKNSLNIKLHFYKTVIRSLLSVCTELPCLLYAMQ